MFVTVSKKSSTETKYSSNRREGLRGGDPCATDRRKNYTIYNILSCASCQQDPQNLTRKQERQRAVAQNCITELSLPLNALSFCSLCLRILEPSGHFLIYHPAGLQSLCGRVSKELGKSKERRKQIQQQNSSSSHKLLAGLSFSWNVKANVNG